MRRPLLTLVCLGLVGAFSISLAAVALSQASAAPSVPPLTPPELLTTPIPGGAPNADALQRGQYLVRIGDCVSCHTREGGEPMAGGLGLNTPFGVIYSPNLTPDARTGIGAWSPDQFYQALHDGVGAHGERLYPAFPYPEFTHVSRADADAMLAYLRTLPAVSYTPPGNRLPFPLNIRFLMRGWNLLFFRAGEFHPDPTKSAQWNRWAYLVTGLGHCGACHTPKNLLGADENSKAFQGGVLDNWTAADLTSDARTGLGRWSSAEIVEYLKTGRTDRAQAGGSMAEVVSFSTSLLSQADLEAIATYLKALPASGRTEAAATPDGGAMQRGAAIYTDACASCHLEKGVGQPRFFPPLAGDTMLQQTNPSGVLHLILAGGRTAPAPTRPTPLSMPSFAWKLTNAEIADVATYIRNSWGNQAPPVTDSEVAQMRRSLGLQTSRLTANSGDRGEPVPGDARSF